MLRSTSLSFAVGLALVSAFFGAAPPAAADPPKLLPVMPVTNAADAKLINVTRAQEVFKDDEDVVVYALRAKAGTCSKLEVDVDGVEVEHAGVAFPYTLVLTRYAKNYPKKDGVHTITLRGKSGDCTGTISTTFVTKTSPIVKGQGQIVGLRLNDYPANGLGKVLIEGTGMCRLTLMVLSGSTWSVAAANKPLFKREFDEPVQLPYLATDLKALPQGDYTAWVVVGDGNDKGLPDPDAAKKHPTYKGCFGQDPQAGHRGIDMGFKSGVGTLYTSKSVAYSTATKGSVTDFRVIGFGSNAQKGALEVKGTGKCRVRTDVFDLAKTTEQPAFRKLFDPPAALPLTVDNIGPLPNGSYRAYLMGYDDALCPVQGPDKQAGGWYVDFRIGPPQQASNNSNSGSPSTPAASGGGGGGSGGSSTKPATGQIASMIVPGGSFAEDDPQKLQVNGKGGCGFDLNITNQSYGGSYNQTFPVLPMKLDSGATLYNGTHFGTLAEGSYHASVTGKNGCSGTAAIDFKVTPKVSTKKVLGKPTISFDQQPKSGGVFSRTKDSNIWFKVQVPQSVKSEPYAGCCDVEFDYMNEYGGWEPLPNSPFNDSSWGLAITQQAGVANKSVSGFSQGTVWRVKVRAYKFKTEFEWSDWLEFKVDQN